MRRIRYIKQLALCILFLLVQLTTETKAQDDLEYGNQNEVAAVEENKGGDSQYSSQTIANILNNEESEDSKAQPLLDVDGDELDDEETVELVSQNVGVEDELDAGELIEESEVDSQIEENETPISINEIVPEPEQQISLSESFNQLPSQPETEIQPEIPQPVVAADSEIFNQPEVPSSSETFVPAENSETLIPQGISSDTEEFKPTDTTQQEEYKESVSTKSVQSGRVEVF